MATQVAGPHGLRQIILVVDDDEPIGQMLALYLTHEGFEVATAGVHTRAALLYRAWAGTAAPDARMVDAHVMSLRRKLTASQCRCQLTTIWGVGYRLDTPARRPEATSA
jgi:DNA-binding response OmpR family regulator